MPPPSSKRPLAVTTVENKQHATAAGTPSANGLITLPCFSGQIWIFFFNPYTPDCCPHAVKKKTEHEAGLHTVDLCKCITACSCFPSPDSCRKRSSRLPGKPCTSMASKPRPPEQCRMAGNNVMLDLKLHKAWLHKLTVRSWIYRYFVYFLNRNCSKQCFMVSKPWYTFRCWDVYGLFTG